MKAARVISPKNLEICEVPMPEIKNSREVLIKVKSVGICGSDIHIYHGTNPVATYPRVIGHEIAGQIVQIGDEVSNFKVEDHVVVDPVINCGHCYACSVGRPNVCSNINIFGVHLDGGYQEYLVVPVENVHRISKQLSWEAAAMVEPFTISAEVVSRAAITSKDTVFIMGAGPIGLCILQAVKRIGARCLISDLMDSRLEKAKEFGADIVINPTRQDVNEIVMKENNGQGVPVVIDAVCIPQTFEQALKLACPAGRVLVLGLTTTPSQVQQLDIMKKELDVRGSRLSNRKFPEVIEWFKNGEVRPEALVSHVFSFYDVKKAMEHAENNPSGTYKVILKFD